MPRHLNEVHILSIQIWSVHIQQLCDPSWFPQLCSEKDKVWHCCALSMDRAGTEQKALDEIFKHGEKPLKEHLKRESAPWKLWRNWENLLIVWQKSIFYRGQSKFLALEKTYLLSMQEAGWYIKTHNKRSTYIMKFLYEVLWMVNHQSNFFDDHYLPPCNLR